MTRVKPSKQYSMTVVPYRPYLRMFWFFALSLTFIVAVIGSFFIGRYYSVGGNGDVVAEYEELKQQYNEKLAQSVKLEQQIANLKLATEVDRKANEEVRSKVVELETQLADLEQDNTFYRSLMRPDPSDKGLVVDAPSVVQTRSAGVYKYNLVIKQIVAQHRKISGYATFELLGKQGDKNRKLALKDISESISVEKIKLSFKYFQRIEGEMALPEGFIPERIDLKVVVQRPKKAVVDKKFGWLVKES